MPASASRVFSKGVPTLSATPQDRNTANRISAFTRTKDLEVVEEMTVCDGILRSNVPHERRTRPCRKVPLYSSCERSMRLLGAFTMGPTLSAQ